MIELRRIIKKKIRKPKYNAGHLDIGNKDAGIAEFRVTYEVLDIHSNIYRIDKRKLAMCAEYKQEEEYIIDNIIF